MGICYNEGTTWDLDDLGNDAWQTGCPLCGDQCWMKGSKADREEIEKSLEELSEEPQFSEFEKKVQGLLNIMLVPVIRIENHCEYSMSLEERLDWVIKDYYDKNTKQFLD